MVTVKLERRKAYNVATSWSVEEENILLEHLKNNILDIKKLKNLFPLRTTASIRSKVRKMRVKNDLFGSSYRDVKSNFTVKIASKVSPTVVFDAYAGAGHQTFKWIQFADTVYACEKVTSKYSQFENQALVNGFEFIERDNDWYFFKKGHKKIFYFIGDAITAAAHIRSYKISIDILDLDTCGSTLPSLPTFLVLLKPKHLLITHGEFHSLRFKREDVLRRILFHKDVNINPLPSLTIIKLADELDRAVKIAGLRAHNETVNSFWLEKGDEAWLGGRVQGMLRRYYIVKKPSATSDCLNFLASV